MAYGEVITALADPTRRQIFESLRSGARTVSSIAADMPVSRPAVSQHLKVLQEANLIFGKPVGNTRVYQIDPHGLNELHSYLSTFWDDVLIAYGAEVTRRALGIGSDENA